MKNVKVFNKQNELVSDQNLYEDPTDFINHIVSTNYWGKAEREVKAKISINDAQGQRFIYPEETYDDVEVVSESTKNTGLPILDANGNLQLDSNENVIREAENWVTLRAEYTIEITDYVFVPQSLTPRQARLALNHFNLRQAVETAIANADQNTKDEWEFANEIRRDWATLTAMVTLLGLTSSQIDDLFIYGANL